MERGFNAEMKSQQEWGWLLSIWLFLSGSAGALFLMFRLFDLPRFFALLSLGAMLLGGAVLLLEQESPLRAWRAAFRTRTSWLSRGVIFVSFFLITGLVSVAPASWLPWDSGGLAGRAVAWIATLCALMIVLYPGFFLASNRSIPFWNTAWLPAVLLSYAALGGSALILLGSAFLRGGLAPFDSFAALLIVLTGILVIAYLLAMHRAGGPAMESVRLLNRPPLAWTFRIGILLVGMLLPLALLLWSPSLVVLAGACMLGGSFLFRYCVLKVGVYVPPALVQEGIDFSRLNRTSADLEREYAGMSAQRAGARS